MDPSRVDVVLVRPARAANVAAACRAMKNMGLGVLRLVDPPAELDQREARSLAYGAWDVLDGALRSPTLQDAVRESTLVAGTSGRPQADDWSPRRLAEEGEALAAGGRLSLVFGPEATGLRRDELLLCHLRVHIPTDPEHSSLNLAQAVLVLAYEIRQAARPPEILASPRATAGELEAAMQDLRRALLEAGFLNPESPEAVLGELRAFFARAAPTPREVTLLRGLARQVGWAGRIARRPGPTG
jgi:tRNA/rRNA methyltransferase